MKLSRPEGFRLNHDTTKCICSAGETPHSPGSLYTPLTGLRYQVFTAKAAHCQSCKLRGRCLPSAGNIKRGKQVTRFEPKTKDLQNPSERMPSVIDSVKGRQLYSQRIGTVEPVFGNIRHNKGLNRLNLGGREKVNAQWHLYCMVHNIEKLAHSGWRRQPQHWRLPTPRDAASGAQCRREAPPQIKLLDDEGAGTTRCTERNATPRNRGYRTASLAVDTHASMAPDEIRFGSLKRAGVTRMFFGPALEDAGPPRARAQ